MKKAILALVLASLAALGGCASTQGIGSRFERNLQLDVGAGWSGATGRRDVGERVSLRKQAQQHLQPTNLAYPGPHDLAIFGEQASKNQRQWPNYQSADGWALFQRLSNVLVGLLDAHKGQPLPGMPGTSISHCLAWSLTSAQCFYDGNMSTKGQIVYKGGHIAFKTPYGILPLY